MVAEHCLRQLADMKANPNVQYKHSSFFTEQLTAFEVWLELGSRRDSPPQQLPMVLQVLLSQTHRLRALLLFARFLDLGPWSAEYSVAVGIFPYLQKLLQTPGAELRRVLVFIWAKALSYDRSLKVRIARCVSDY